MLTALTIRNVVLIDHLDIEFQKGFCALTGETGAGKSVLLDSLGLALGRRSEAGLVRKGADQAQVSAEFHLLKPGPINKILHRADIAVAGAGASLVLRRVVSRDGRSRAFINDQSVSVSTLREVGDMLVEIHGQFDTQGLLDPKTHGALLDEYAGLDVSALRECWTQWKRAEKHLQEERQKMEEACEEEEYLRQAIEDLDALEPQEGEEERLSALRERLMKREQIMASLDAAYQALSATDEPLGVAWKELGRAGEGSQTMQDGLDRASAEIQEVVAQIQSLSADMEQCEYSLEEIDDRLHDLKGQARKHQCAVDDLPRIRSELAEALSKIDKQDSILQQLHKDVEAARQKYVETAEENSIQRQKAAEKLDRLVAKELPPLKLDKARFETRIERLDEEVWGPNGLDKVSFLVATNPGREPGPLNKIASGGEMARFMLALKVVMADVGIVQSMVFDEVDTGIGGSTAAAVGERLAKLADTRQVLVVTHSPQVAARANHHFIVMKDSGDDVRTLINPLDEFKKRREEIARMLSGETITEEARAAADKLLETGT